MAGAVDGDRDSGYFRDGASFVGDCVTYLLTSRISEMVVERFFGDYREEVRTGINIFAAMAVVRMSQLPLYVKIPALVIGNIFAAHFVKQEPSFESYWQVMPKREKMQEASKSRLSQLVMGLGGKEKPHLAVISNEETELSNLVGQLPLTKRYKDYTVVMLTGQIHDLMATQVLHKYLAENPKTILYFPYGFIASHGLSQLPKETLVIAGMPSFSVWNEMKSRNVNRYKEIMLIPLSRHECIELIKEDAGDTSQINIAVAVELAFLFLGEKGGELTLAKDILERVSKMNDPSKEDVFTVFGTMYPTLVASSEKPVRSFNEIAEVMNLKFGIGKTVEKIPENSDWEMMAAQEEIQEGLKSQVSQIAAAIGGKERPHVAIIGADEKELDHVLTQLPLLPGFRDLKIFKWTGEVMSSDILDEIPEALDGKTLLYIPFGYVPAGGLRELPEDMIVVIGIPHYSLWDEIKGMDLASYKEVQLKPLTREECLLCLEKWVEAEVDWTVLEGAVEMAFLLLQETGGELTLAKDLIERTSKAGDVTLETVWKTFSLMYPNLAESLKYQTYGPYARLPKRDLEFSMKSLDQIGSVINKKFNTTFPLSPVKVIETPSFLTDLNEKMKAREQFAVGNDRRIAELKTGLTGLDKTNALLIGIPGTGKTTLVESIAWMIAHDQMDEKSPFYGKTIYSLDVNKMMAGTMWVGTTNERVTELFAFLSQQKDAILFVDEIQQMMGAGSSHGNEMGSYAQLMKPYLLAYGITVIGATTPGEYKKWIQTDTTAAFGRRFREIFITEPTEEECVLMLNHIIQSDLFKAAYPGIVFEEGSVQLAVHLMGKISSKIGDPDKSKDFIEKLAGSLLNSRDKKITAQEVEKYFNITYKKENLKDKEVPIVI